MAVRSGKYVEDLAFWYNNSPNTDGKVPSEVQYNYQVRLPNVSKERRVVDCNPFQLGEAVGICEANEGEI